MTGADSGGNNRFGSPASCWELRLMNAGRSGNRRLDGFILPPQFRAEGPEPSGDCCSHEHSLSFVECPATGFRVLLSPRRACNRQLQEMPRYLHQLPDHLKELVVLCRSGRLFAIEEWIRSGRPFNPGPGHYSITPFRAALKTGFHSLVELFLRAGIEKEEKNRALVDSVRQSRLELIELLVKYGADWSAVKADTVIAQRNPAIIRWFVERGLDMETGWPIASAFKNKHREFLGIYLSLRDAVPSARHQANMALKFHAGEGNLKWVSLLMWAGADPRAKVPDLDREPPEEWMGTAIEEAVWSSHFEILKKIGIEPSRDDPSALLAGCWMCHDIKVVRYLLEAGADPNSGDGERNPMHALMRNFEWSLDPAFSHRSPAAAIGCLELAAERGGRWRPFSSYDRRTLRTSLASANSHLVTPLLHRLVKANVFTREVFQDLMDAPRMKQLLASAPHALRDFASPGSAKFAEKEENI